MVEKVKGLVRPVGAFIVIAAWTLMSIVRLVYAISVGDLNAAAEAFLEYVAPTGPIVMYWFKDRGDENVRRANNQ